MRRTTIGVLGVLALVASGCGGDDPRRVTAADIVPLPPGTAVGSLYSGDYLLTSGQVEDCKCRLGGCASLTFLQGVVMSFAQTDGTIVMTSSMSPAVAFTGAVDSDGSFRINGSIVETAGEQYLLMDGQFAVSNGAPTGVTFTQEASFVNPPYDCDLRVSVRGELLEP